MRVQCSKNECDMKLKCYWIWCNMICIHNFDHSERKNIYNITFKTLCRPLRAVVGGTYIWWRPAVCIYYMILYVNHEN